MFCTNCGQQLPDGSKFCPSCGTVLDERAEAAAQPEAPQQPIAQPEPPQPAYQQPIAQPEPLQQPVYQQPVYQQPVYQQPVPYDPPQVEAQQYSMQVPASAQPLGSKRPRGCFVAAGILCLIALLFQLGSVAVSVYALREKLDFSTIWQLAKLEYAALLLLFTATLVFLLPTKRVAFVTAIPRALGLALALYLLLAHNNEDVLSGYSPLFTLRETEGSVGLLLKIALALNAVCCALYLLGTLLKKTGTVIPVIHLILSLCWLGLLCGAAVLLIVKFYDFSFYSSLMEVVLLFSALFYVLAYVAALFRLRRDTRSE